VRQHSVKLESALRGLEARGSSIHLNNALARAISLLENRPKGERRIIVVFSDGHDLGSDGGGSCRVAIMEIPTETHQNEAAIKVFNFAQTGPLLNWYLA